MQKVIIRPPVPGDIGTITRIYADAVLHGTASFEIEPPTETEMLLRQTALLKNGYPYFVAESESVVAGYAYAGPYRTRPAYNWSVEDSVYVAPDMHRKGIGALLLRALIAAGALRSIGFKHGKWLDTVLMQRALGQGDTTTPKLDAAHSRGSGNPAS